MRIAIDARFLEETGGGIGKYIRELLSRRNEDFKFICISSKPINNLPSDIVNEVLPLRGHWLVWEQIQLPLLLKKINPDIYHATSNWGVPLFSPVPVIVTMHDIIPLTFSKYFSHSHFPILSKWLYSTRIKIGLYIAKIIICTSPRLATELLSVFHLKQKKLTVIPMGVSDQFFNKTGSKNKSWFKNNKFRVPGSYILSHGGMDQRKNNINLIKAYARVLNTKNQLIDNTVLLITGKNTRLKQSLQELAEKLHILDKVKFIGWVDEGDIYSLVKNARLVVYPTSAEGFGLPLLEAMAAKVPIVVSDIPALREIGKDVPIYVNPKDIRDMARGLQEGLMDNSRRRLRIGQGIAKQYTWEKAIKDTFRVYSEIL